jgi:hypothetical protein
LDTDSGPYDNAVFVAPDFDPSNLSPQTWRMIGDGPSSSGSILTSLEVSGSDVFAGGYGFLKRCRIEAGKWGSVAGLPVLNSEMVGVSALASDGHTLYVGTAGEGLFALSLASNDTSLVSVSGTGSAGLPSMMVNGLRSVDGNLYVATPAGLVIATTILASVPAVAGGSTGGGCSMALAGEPDPLLWLLVFTAALQIGLARRRRLRLFRLPDSVQQTKSVTAL